MTIYNIMTFNCDMENEILFHDTRIVGFYTDKETALQMVYLNNCDIHEYSYQYAIVEAVEDGFYGATHERYFFEWNDEERGYRMIPEPEKFNHIVGFTMG